MHQSIEYVMSRVICNPTLLQLHKAQHIPAREFCKTGENSPKLHKAEQTQVGIENTHTCRTITTGVLPCRLDGQEENMSRWV